MVAKVRALVPNWRRPAGVAGALWLASELLTILALASCEAEPILQGAARLIG
jgi:hypothetical protein